MWYGLLADLVVALHLAYVSYVVFGLVLIALGLVFRWSWIRNPWFRWSHLIMIGIVAFESVGGVECPLTTWEYDLRHAAGQKIDSHSDDPDEQPTFIGKMMHDVMFFDVPYNHPGFTIAYVTFALVVLVAFVVAPPRASWRVERREK